MESININLLIAKEQFEETRSQDHFVVSDQISKAMEPILKELNAKSVIITNYSDKDHLYCIDIQQSECQIIETKEEKKRTFSIDMIKRFIQIDGRRALQDDIQKFSKQSRLLGMHVLKSAPQVFIKSQTQSQAPDNMALTNIAQKFSIETDGFEPLTDITETGKQVISTTLIQFSKQLLPSGERVVGGKDEQEETLISKIKTALKKINDDPKSMVHITNRALKKAVINTVYDLKVFFNKSDYLEESPVAKKVVKIDFETDEITLNQDPMTTVAIKWFSEKLNHIGSELVSKQTQMHRFPVGQG